jgi:hypothetical protein
VELQKRADALRWEIERQTSADLNAYFTKVWEERMKKMRESQGGERTFTYSGPSQEQIKNDREAQREIQSRWGSEYRSRLTRMQEEFYNQARHQQRLAMALSAVSPLSAVTLASMDLARTGFVQHERMEKAVALHLAYVSDYVRGKESALAPGAEKISISDYTRFTYQDLETVAECLSRNAIHILNLTLLTVAGFAGAYVAILRYDVR